MVQLPMIPDWDGIHPLLVHWPLTLFFLAPVFALIAALTKATFRRTFLLSSLAAMLLGTISIYVAFDAGESAAINNPVSEASAVMEHHHELAGLARSSLTGATLFFSLTLLLCLSFHLSLRELTAVLPLGSAIFYGFGLFWLVHTAYLGERLVHEFGIGGIVRP